jgi:stage II sporulation protein D
VRRVVLAGIAVTALACRTVATPVPVVQPTLEPPPGAPSTGTVPRLAPTPPSAPVPRAPAGLAAAKDAGQSSIRVALALNGQRARMGSAQGWELLDGGGAHVLIRAPAGEQWNVERDGHMLRATRDDGLHTDWVAGPVLARVADTGLLVLNAKRYRGELEVRANDSGLVIVNRLVIDEYLRGVVPLEIGPRAPAESAAVQAQAVAARSYAFVHLASGGTVVYDVTATVLDQVYGGADAETPSASSAVESTRGLVLKYAGRVVNAPYHSSCGGMTAEPEDVWHSGSVPYLKRVSDQIPGSDRMYCDIAPGFRWTRTFSAADLNAAVARYLASYTSVPGGNPGQVRDVTIGSKTPSGRVGTLTVSTDRGNFVLSGNDIRYVLRSPAGEILNSTMFSVESSLAGDQHLATLTVHGMGNGHGVGMCQWGAIGRARAGQDFRTILATYYPGTTVGTIE